MHLAEKESIATHSTAGQDLENSDLQYNPVNPMTFYGADEKNPWKPVTYVQGCDWTYQSLRILKPSEITTLHIDMSKGVSPVIFH